MANLYYFLFMYRTITTVPLLPYMAVRVEVMLMALRKRRVRLLLLVVLVFSDRLCTIIKAHCKNVNNNLPPSQLEVVGVGSSL